MSDPTANTQGAIIGSVVTVSGVLLALITLSVVGSGILIKYRHRESPIPKVSENELIDIRYTFACIMIQKYLYYFLY